VGLDGSFHVLIDNFPVLRNYFPVLYPREFEHKTLTSLEKLVSNFLLNAKFLGNPCSFPC
jgi:hypothetical protein